jgi:recombination protein RecA
VRLDIRKVTGIKDGDVTVGSRTKVRVVKNKVAPPFRVTEFDLMHDRGISREGDLIDLGIEDDIIQKSGGHHSYGEVRLGNGRENVKQFLRDNPALMEEIGRKILENRGLLPPVGDAADNGEVETPAAAEPETTPKSSRRRAAATE